MFNICNFSYVLLDPIPLLPIDFIDKKRFINNFCGHSEF